jgi:4-phytase/acid phosphatase/peptide/nickel transport system substrate-binding protein
VLQQLWKNVGAEMEIEQVDQATIPARAFQRKFDITPWRIVDFPDPDVQMFANFYSKSPLNLASFSDPDLDKALEAARTTADEAQRTEHYCEASRIINKNATWFFTFQNTYYAMAKAKVKGVPKLYGGVIDVSHAWLE